MLHEIASICFAKAIVQIEKVLVTFGKVLITTQKHGIAIRRGIIFVMIGKII